MPGPRHFEYRRLWLPLFQPSTFAPQRAVYLLETEDGFAGHVTEKGVTLISILNGFGSDGWLIALVPDRYATASEFQLLVDAALDEAGESPQVVSGFDVLMMRRRSG